MKEDGGAVVVEVGKAPSCALDDQGLAVEPFRDGIGNAMLDVGHDVGKVPFDHPGHFADRFQIAMRGAEEPLDEEATCPGLGAVGV